MNTDTILDELARDRGLLNSIIYRDGVTWPKRKTVSDVLNEVAGMIQVEVNKSIERPGRDLSRLQDLRLAEDALVRIMST